MRLVVPVTDWQSRRLDEPAISQTCLAFFAAFAQQLQYLTLTALSRSARACQRLFASVLACTRLVSLKLSNDLAVGQPIALPAHIEPLLQLRKLYIRSPASQSGRASHVQHEDVVRLLGSCPALLDLSLSLPNASISLLSTIAHACPQLCDLTLRSDGTSFWDAGPQLSTLTALESTIAFTSLHTLYIDSDLLAGQTTQQPDEHTMSALSRLFCRAPIRRLCLLPHIDVTNLHFYASFPHLVRLCLHDQQLHGILLHYCYTPDPSSRTYRSDAERRVNMWMARTRGGRWGTEEGSEQSEDEEDVDASEAEEDVWLSCPPFVYERVFVENGRALTGREAWLERGLLVAAAETERRRVVALEKARAAAEEKAKRQQKARKRSREQHASELSAADAFFAASGIKRKR